ncbi:hypothetical protein ACQY1M_24945 (plasmid) [Neorhizobium sp. DAR64861/K0K2]|uniref:hypothetical protein n=1 Tax=Neorhizobium sp. DAR64861/K0K2 TaxID=3421956 RepID=UPI003D298353
MFDQVPEPTKAAECCCQLIQAYLSDPEHVDWGDVQTAVNTALEAFDLPPTFFEEQAQIA